MNEEKEKKRKKIKIQTKEVIINKEQTKFFANLSNVPGSLSLIFDFLLPSFEKNYGKPILFKDVCLHAASKLTA